MALLEVEGLTIGFGSRDRPLPVVQDAAFSVERGETVALVGESGSGKSVTALAIMRLLESPGRILAGRAALDGRDLTRLSERAMRRIRGNRIAMVFQEPMASMNPVLSVGAHVAEPLVLHQGLSARIARDRAVELLGRVGIPSPERRVDEYPHRLSGGMRQRVMIAAALACKPDLLIADEPTTALDVTIQAQILDLLAALQAETGMAVLFITHDLGVVAEQAQRVVVMYAGRVVERAPAAALFARPLHPYAAALLRCIPAGDGEQKLEAIEGSVPAPARLPPGCRFAPRCPLVLPACEMADPTLRAILPGQDAACIRAGAVP
jgi:oligopeptide/dipeptide ABC transporter ATP-binding protein